MAVKKLAPLGNNKESASVEKLQEEASEVLETSKSYLKSGYGFARNHWKPLTAVIVAAVLCAVGYHYGVHQHMYEGIAKVSEKAKGAWGWITSKFKKKTIEAPKEATKPPEPEPPKTFERSEENPPKEGAPEKKRKYEVVSDVSSEFSDSEYSDTLESPTVETVPSTDLSGAPETVITEGVRKHRKTNGHKYLTKHPEAKKKVIVIT
jgi:hypothetical protein